MSDAVEAAIGAGAADTAEAPPRSARARRAANASLSLADLLRRLVDDSIALLRAELQLASIEMRDGARAAAVALVAVLFGVMLIGVALLCLLGGLVAWLAQGMGIVAAALTVGAIILVIGGLALAFGIGALRNVDLAPRRLTANLKYDAKVLTGE